MASVVEGSPAATPANTTSARAGGINVARMKTASSKRRSQGEAVSLSIGCLVLIVTPAKNVRRNRGEAGAETVTPHRPGKSRDPYRRRTGPLDAPLHRPGRHLYRRLM